MTAISNHSTLSCILSVSYTTTHSQHLDHYYCEEVNLWRDVFTDKHRQSLLGTQAGETIHLDGKYCITDRSKSCIYRITRAQWQPPSPPATPVQPRLGRWYPQGFLQGIPGIFPQTMTPFRVLDADTHHLEIDCNHPLAGRELDITLSVEQVTQNMKERGGRCTDWLAKYGANGPGMQCFLEKGRTDYEDEGSMIRVSNEDDGYFYSTPRMVNHIDSQARSHLLAYTSSLISPEMKVLDLMSSMQSHLPQGPSVTGLGMNHQEMAANPVLSDYLVHNVNTTPQLPFEDNNFDAICCHLSFEYLLNPQKIIAECRRVLKKGGPLIISFSNRWFPEKVTRLWQQLHEFERLGYVMETIHQHFSNLQTISFRNWPRPTDDPHFSSLETSDPLFIVIAQKY